MADLDDFFAKKDRKKGKSSKKYSTPDEIAKKIEDTKQKNVEKVRKDRLPAAGQENEDGAAMPGDEDEWREVVEAKKDYTGLKIQPLAPGEGGAQQQGQGGEARSNNASGNTPQDSKQKGPWNKAENAPAEEEREAPAEAPAPRPAPPPATSGKYVMPYMRNRPQDSPARPNRNQKNHAPDIHNEEYFPSLGGEVPASGKKAGPGGGGAWTEAGGARSALATSRAQPERLALGNRFTSLTHDS